MKNNQTSLPQKLTPRVLLLLVLFAVQFSATQGAEPNAAVSVAFDASGPGTMVVADPAASGKKALAIDVGSVSGNVRLKTVSPKLEAGRYRVTLHARLYSAAKDDLSRLKLDWTVRDAAAVRAKKPLVWTQFDSGAERYTAFETELTVASTLTPSFEMGWTQVTAGPADRAKPIRKIEPPSAPNVTQKTTKPKSVIEDDLLGEITNAGKVTPLSEVDYPALLIDRVTFEPISRSQWIEAVQPKFLHTYPGQSNPIEVRVRNFENRKIEATVQLEIRAGLDELLHTATLPIQLASNDATTCRFEWPGSPREFGHEVRVTLIANGKTQHVASDYYSVSFPIWKTALQASGFLDWYGREAQLAEHVLHNRATYLNVEEAFSWQPSSWTNLTPETEHWWSGQGDVHNNVAGLKQWLDQSHDHGIKMITYLWSSASGPDGLEWARQHPELVTHVNVGLASEFWDVEDLRLKPILEANPRLWRLRSGIWNNVGVNRGMLRAIDKGVSETIESSKRFGWDGARFDSPPAWSAMGAETMHSEFAQLKVEPLIKKLVPEHFDQQTGTWSGDAVSVTNVRYARHRFQEHNPHFALSYNIGYTKIVPGVETKFYDACCAEGGQIMDEEIRQLTRQPWRNYMKRIHEQANLARQRGGYHCVVSPNASSAVIRCYAAISTFVGGSHPYLDFGWSQPLPGTYTQFMTRFGEYCWAPDLAPTTADDAHFTASDEKTLWWRDLLRQRKLPDGQSQWVVHLIANPPSEQMTPENPGTMTPWNRSLSIQRQSQIEPTVWALTAEPTTRAVQLKPRKSADGYVVDVPELRQWVVLLWTEPAQK